MAESLFIKVDEVGELLGISRAEAYRIIKKLNSELAEKGYIVISGRVSRRYLEEQIYGMRTEKEKGGGRQLRGDHYHACCRVPAE